MNINPFTLILTGIIWCVVGIVITDGDWKNDCKTIGMHRHNDKIYICSEKK